jgi:predicted DNA-binding WGR domain protein
MPVPEHQHADELSVEQLAQFTHAVRFVSHDPATNRHRYYLLSWQRTLDGTTVLVATWGRMQTHGRSRMLCTADQPHVQDLVVRIIKRRFQRGYQVTEWH